MAPKGHTHSRNLTVTPRSFLLPSYPLSTLPGKNLTPTLPRRQSDLASSMSNTWPNKKENSPPPQDNQPVKDTAGAVKGIPPTLHRSGLNVLTSGCVSLTLLLIPLPGAHLSSRCSPQLLRASLMSPSMSSFRRALSGNRTTFSVSPVVPKAEQVQSYNGQRSTAPGCPDINLLDSLSLDPDDGISMMQDPQDEDPPDIQEVVILFLLFKIQWKQLNLNCYIWKSQSNDTLGAVDVCHYSRVKFGPRTRIVIACV